MEATFSDAFGSWTNVNYGYSGLYSGTVYIGTTQYYTYTVFNGWTCSGSQCVGGNAGSGNWNYIGSFNIGSTTTEDAHFGCVWYNLLCLAFGYGSIQDWVYAY